LKYIILLSVLLLTACDNGTINVPPDKVVITDQCLQREIFKECLTVMPAGPLATKYNDWDEVVVECRRSANYMAQRQRGIIKEECRAR
jgi:hypothetical protein